MAGIRLTAEQITEITERVSQVLRTTRRWDAMTPEERAEAEKQAIARMPDAYREWYLKTFGKGQL